jgi:hypothetical protein
VSRREDTIKRSIAWPASMYEAIERQAKRRKIPLSAYIRFAVEQQLQADGEDVRDDLLWGGARYIPEEADEGQAVAVAAC